MTEDEEERVLVGEEWVRGLRGMREIRCRRVVRGMRGIREMKG